MRKRITLFLFSLLIATTTIAQFENVEIKKGTEESVTDANTEFWDQLFPFKNNGKIYGVGVDLWANFYTSKFNENEFKLENSKKQKKFFWLKYQCKFITIGDNCYYTFLEKVDKNLVLKIASYNPETSSLGKEIPLSEFPYKEYFYGFANYEVKVNKEKNTISIIIYHVSDDKEKKITLEKITLNKDLKELLRFKKVLGTRESQNDEIYEFEDKFSNSYIIRTGKGYKIRQFDITKINGNGKAEKLKLNTSEEFIEEVFLKDDKVGTVYLVGFSSYNYQKKIAKNILVWKLDTATNIFVKEIDQPLNLFQEGYDEKITQYMTNLFPAINPSSAPVRYNFVAKNIYFYEDGSKLIVGRGLAFKDIAEIGGGGDGSGYPLTGRLSSAILTGGGVGAEPGFIACKITKENTIQWVNEFYTHYFYDVANTPTVEKNGDIYILYPYLKGVYKNSSISSMSPVHKLMLTKITADGKRFDKELDDVMKFESAINVIPHEGFLITTTKSVNPKETNTSYNRNWLSKLIEIKIK